MAPSGCRSDGMHVAVPHTDECLDLEIELSSQPAHPPSSRPVNSADQQFKLTRPLWVREIEKCVRSRNALAEIPKLHDGACCT
jgi:hypothetical protein